MRLGFRVRILIGISVLMLTGLACDGPGKPTNLLFQYVTPNSALGYQSTWVEVHGAGFDRETSVTLGGKAARVQFVDAKTLRVETPLSDPGVVDVVVTNARGVEARIANGFTFRAFGPTELFPRQAFASYFVAVRGAGFLPGARVLFDGVDVVVRSTRATEIVVVAPARGSGTVDVTVINAGGRTATLVRGFTYSTIELSTNITSVAPGGGLVISWDGPRSFCYCFDEDRLGLFRVGDPNDRPVWEIAVDIGTGSRSLTAPAVPGQYEFRYFVYESSDIFRTPVIVVGPSAPAP